MSDLQVKHVLKITSLKSHRNLYHSLGYYSQQNSTKQLFPMWVYSDVTERYSAALVNAFKKLKHCSIIMGCWYIHRSAHLLF